MKKRLALILLLCIALGCFTACGDGSEHADDGKMTVAPSATAAANSETEDTLLGNKISKQESYLDNGEIAGGVYSASESEPIATTSPVASDPHTKNDCLEIETPLPTRAPSATLRPVATNTPDIRSTPRPTKAPVATARPTATRRPVITNTPVSTDPQGSTYPGYIYVSPTYPSPTPVGYTLPDNSDLDCLSMDFRRGYNAFCEYKDGYAYIQTGEPANRDCFLDATESLTNKPGAMKVYIEGSDPYFYMYSNIVTGDTIDLELQEYPFLKIVMKNNTSSSSFDFFLFNQNGNCTEAEKFTVSGISTNDTEFKTYYIDLRATGASNSLTVGKGSASLDRYFSAIRFDAPGSSGSVEIQYMGFFKTIADAQAYR